MHPRVFQEFEKICQRRGAGGSILEIGSVPSDESLLCLEVFSTAEEKIGISLEGPTRYKDFEILKCDANNMDCFSDNRFDTIVCNAMLEHDRFFWKTINEIKRVLKPNGILVIGVPGYKECRIAYLQYYLERIIKLLPIYNSFIINYLQFVETFYSGTITFRVHNCPGDYYRFSSQAVVEVFFADFVDVEVIHIMSPPRILASGIKPANKDKHIC